VLVFARTILTAMRPRQWTKNLVAFAPLIFSRAYAHPADVALASAAFAVLCALSSASYLVNDVRDAAADRTHPVKRARPVAAGQLPPKAALVASAVLTVCALGASFTLGVRALALAAGFVALQAAYTFALKCLPLVDAMTTSGGFVLRAMVGAAAIGVPDSEWLLVCAALLAMFLALAKRRHELVILGPDAVGHRSSLAGSSPALMDEMIAAVTGATIASYAVYAYFVAGLEGHRHMVLTVPFVVYGLFRYLHLVHSRNLGGNPEEVLLSDLPLMACIALYLVAVRASGYGDRPWWARLFDGYRPSEPAR
jgi:4-hydroxybenzoate polyprenyltransferase